ncbi:dihydrolipoamide succinyltransferase component (E2) [Salmonella enterica subsp. arizonae]|uniref:Dihydrolipoyllysine-residue succinyltransferase n=1 Tax=Salmonella enterica subsp. arizonae TaxID=59203 RepID=A0A379TDN4_SALER|nr:dihydrolipoamide succinyltransferase component (E2) [Salmonella enterica subsp. arizonae]
MWKKHLAKAPAKDESKAPETAPAAQPALGARGEKRVPMTRLRKRVAERLLEAKNSTAMLTTFNEVNMKPIMDLRKQYGEVFEKRHGIRLGFMSFYVKAVVEALKRYPEVNASIDGDDVVYHNYFDVSMAVSTPRGLVTPVLRDVDTLGMADIEKKIKELAVKGRDGKLTVEDLTGGNFTITNGGVFGSLMSTPIINPPQSAILGMHAIKDRPMAIDGKVEILPMMYFGAFLRSSPDRWSRIRGLPGHYQRAAGRSDPSAAGRVVNKSITCPVGLIRRRGVAIRRCIIAVWRRKRLIRPTGLR